MRRTLLALLAVLVIAAPTAAQRRTGAGAFAIEAAGGIAGSAAGLGIGYALADDCGTDDLECYLESAGTALLASTVLAAAGTWIAGRLGDTRPSVLGAALGSIAGAGAGIGIWHLLSEELGWVESDAGVIVAYTVTQGVVTAAGSRLVRALRD